MSTDDDFERFFLAHYDSIVRSVTMIIGDRERATDAVQDAFIKAYAKWGTVRTYDLPAMWVRRIAINRSRDSHRSERRRARRERPFVESPASSPAEGVIGMTVAMQLVQRLPPQQRSVAVLFYLDDLSIEEIGLILGLNEGTVKFHLNRARNRLREVLARDEVGGAITVAAAGAGAAWIGDGATGAGLAGGTASTVAPTVATGGAVDGATGAVIVVAWSTVDAVVPSPLPTVRTGVGATATASTGSPGSDPSTSMSSASPDPMQTPTRITARQWANRWTRVGRPASIVIES